MIRLVVALLPLALIPLLANLIATGRIDLGGGEKDLAWIVPLLLWSILFGASSLLLWHRGWRLVRSVVWSAAVGLAGVLIGAAILALFGQLGIAGRF